MNEKGAEPSSREVEGVGLLPFACWDCGFESRWRHGYLKNKIQLDATY
jgi:hypothetical protein